MTARRNRDEALCLHIDGARICVGAIGHKAGHYYRRLPDSSRRSSHDLYLDGVRPGSVVRSKHSPASGMRFRVDHVFTDGVVLMRSLATGGVKMIGGDDFGKHYFVLERG